MVRVVGIDHLVLSVGDFKASKAFYAPLMAFLGFKVEQIVSGLAITILAGAAGLSSFLANTWDLGRAPVPHRLELFDVVAAPDSSPQTCVVSGPPL